MSVFISMFVCVYKSRQTRTMSTKKFEDIDTDDNFTDTDINCVRGYPYHTVSLLKVVLVKKQCMIIEIKFKLAQNKIIFFLT